MARLDGHRRSASNYTFAEATLVGCTGLACVLLAQSKSAFSDAIEQWLCDRLAEPYRLDRLARAFAVSPRTLLRRFQAEADDSPLSYLRRARVEAAKKLLESTTLSVAEIVERIGYENVSAFVRLFGGEVGHSPARYRAMSRVDSAGPAGNAKPQKRKIETLEAG